LICGREAGLDGVERGEDVGRMGTRTPAAAGANARTVLGERRRRRSGIELLAGLAP